VLYETDVPDYKLPFVLDRVYGKLGFKSPVLYSNFVTSIDGVATLGSGLSAGSVISGKNPGDRFLMGLLRAWADAVIIGAGTLRATPGHRWTPSHVFPDLAAGFTALRVSLNRSPEPRLVVVTARGDVDPTHPAIVAGATVITTTAGELDLKGKLPDTCDVAALGKGERLDLSEVVSELRRRGHQVLLTEGGPTLMGQLVQAGLVDEIFLTLSPVLAGREKAERRLGMIEDVALLPKNGVWSRLLSARRQDNFLFLRYATG
jgi:riboflavin biosynthesis pyrimidine reductase